MPYKCLMTWNARQKRWSKKYRNRQHFRSCKQLGAPATKEGSRVAANKWWEAKKREIDSENEHADDYRHAIAVRKRLLAMWEKNGRGDWLVIPDGVSTRDAEATFLRDKLERMSVEVGFLEEALQSGKSRQLTPGERDPEQFLIESTKRWEAFFSSQMAWVEGEKPEANDKPTLGSSIADFLRDKLEEVETDNLSAGRYDCIRGNLQHFQRFAGGDNPLSIDSQLLTSYRTHLRDEIKDGTIAPATARDRLAAVCQFVRHLWRNEYIDQPPRVLDALTIRVATKPVETFTDEEVALMLTAKERAKLYLLLSLNCGMLQKDISDLQQSEVDWEAGRITRKRSKTRHHEGVPTVCYKLWPETFQLLTKYRSGHPELALTNRNGERLKRESIVNGKLKVVCNISSVYDRLRTKLGIKNSYNKLRKTSASKLGDDPRYYSCRIQFLGQSDRTIADKHYVKPSQRLFDEAIEWLGEQFGMVDAAQERMIA